MDAVNSSGGSDGDFDFSVVVCGAKNATMANDFVGGGGNATDKPDVCDEYGLDVVVCIICWNYGGGAEADKIFLRGPEAGIFGQYDTDDGERDDNDIADSAVLLWANVANFGGGKSFDFANVAICDGNDVSYWGSSWGAFGGICGGMDGANGA